MIYMLNNYYKKSNTKNQIQKIKYKISNTKYQIQNIKYKKINIKTIKK
jgi:hypothetical protein